MTDKITIDRTVLQQVRDALTLADNGEGYYSYAKEIIALQSALAAIEAHEAWKNLIRFCPECGHLGEISVGARDCCPDGSHAAYMPRKTAERCARLFHDLLASAPQASVKQEPLSDEQIESIRLNVGYAAGIVRFTAIVRAIESAKSHVREPLSEDEKLSMIRESRLSADPEFDLIERVERAHGIPIAKPPRSAQQ